MKTSLWRKTLALTIGAALLLPGLAFASGQHTTKLQKEDDRYEVEGCTKDVKWTAGQKKKLNQKLDQFYEANKALLDTYSESGALTAAQKDIRLKHLKAFVESVKQNQYRICTEMEDRDIEYELKGMGGEQEDDDHFDRD